MSLTVLKSKTSVHRNLLWNIFGMKSTGQNKSLLLSSPHPPKNSSLDYHSWMRMPLWKSRSTAEKFQHATGGKKIKTKTKTEIGHIKEGMRKQFPFTHIIPPLRQHNSVPREVFSVHDFSHRGKWVCVSVDNLQCVGGHQRVHFLLIHYTWGVLHDWRQGVSERIAARTIRACQSDADSTNFFTASTRKPTHELLGQLHLWMPPVDQEIPPKTGRPSPHSQLPVHALDNREWTSADGL